MRRYETIIILNPDLSDDARGQFLDRITDLIPKENGFLVLLDQWGDRKLAYTVRKKNRGFYLRIDYCGNGTLVNEIERHCRIDENALKHMTVLLDEDVDVDAVKEEIKSREAAKAEADKKDQEIKEESIDSTSGDEPDSSNAPEPTNADNNTEETEAVEKE